MWLFIELQTVLLFESKSGLNPYAGPYNLSYNTKAKLNEAMITQKKKELILNRKATVGLSLLSLRIEVSRVTINDGNNCAGIKRT